MIHTEQEMVNWVNRQRAIAPSKDPPYVPYLAPKLSGAPWVVPNADHASARTSWIAYSRQARRAASPQETSIQSFSLYHMRFVFAAELCGAFGNFGGLATHLSHFPTILNLSITESVGTALAYHQIFPNKLQERARQRSAKITDFEELLQKEDFPTKEQAKKEIDSAVEKDKRGQQSTRDAAANRNRNINQNDNAQPKSLPPVLRNNRQRLYPNQKAERPPARSRSRSPRRQHYNQQQNQHQNQQLPARQQNGQRGNQQNGPRYAPNRNAHHLQGNRSN